MPPSNPIRALKLIGALLLSSTRLEAALDVYATNSTIGASLDYPTGGSLDGMELRPGVIATMADPEGIDFNDGSSLIFDVIGYNVGLINASNTTGAIFFAEGSSIFMDVVGTPPPNGTYELIRGEIGTEAEELRVILRNYPGATIITDYNDEGRYIRATIINFNRPSVPQTIINQTVLTSDATFNRNIVDSIPHTPCDSQLLCGQSQTAKPFDYNTSSTIAWTLHRFTGASYNRPFSKAPLVSLPGIKAQQTDLLKVINEGQLPTSQFNLPHKGIRVWMTGIYNYFRNKLDHLDYRAASKGVQIGIDSTTSCLPIGLSFSYIATRPKIDKMSSGRNKTFQVGIYGGHGFNNFKLFGTLSYIHGRNKIKNLTQLDFNTNSFSAYAIGSYLHRLNKKNILEPLVTFSYGRTWAPTLYEYRQSFLSSTTKSNESNSLRSEMGLRLSHLTEINNKALVPLKFYIQALWKHNYVNKHSTGRIFYTNYKGVTILSSQRQPKNMADLGLGVIARKDNTEFSLFYGTSFARKVQNHTGMAGIRLTF